MNQFVSPTTGVFNLENLKITGQHKLGSNIFPNTRKPFVDRKVNCNTPSNNVQKQQQFSLPLKDVTIKKSIFPGPTESLEINPEDIFSFKHFDTPFKDFLPYSPCLNQETVYTILSNWVRNSTPPPSSNCLDMSSDFEEIPEQEFAYRADSFYQDNINKFQFEDCLADVKVPYLEDM